MQPPRDALLPAVTALWAHAPTSRHAEMLFDVLVDHLEEQGFLVTENDGTLRKLYRREAPGSPLVVPWPVAELSVRGRIGFVSKAFNLEGEVLPDPEPLPGRVPRLRKLGPAQITLHDGPTHLTIVYGEDGRAFESSIDDRFPSRLGEIVDALATKKDQPVELIAACVARIDPRRHGTGRVRIPVPVPGGVAGTYQAGLFGVRRALFAGRVPPSARFVVADAVAGTAVGSGATLEEATAAFEAEVVRSMPQPLTEWQTSTDDYDDDGNLISRGKLSERLTSMEDGAGDVDSGDDEMPTPSFDPESRTLHFGEMVVRGPKSDVEMPELTLATIPSVVITLEASPTVEPPTGRWQRLVGGKGATAHVVRRDDPEGFLLIGERALPHVNLLTLEAALDQADAQSDLPLEQRIAMLGEQAAYVRFYSVAYRWVERTPKHPARWVQAGSQTGPKFEPIGLDGDVEVDLVRRHRRVRRGTWSPGG